jgi:tRNA(fMet)-specific endonuclease VapC
MRGFGGDKRAALEKAIRRLVVLSPDEQTTRMWADLRAGAQRAGMSKDPADLWIAATARRHDLPLLTADKGFLTALDIAVIHPDDPPAGR